MLTVQLDVPVAEAFGRLRLRTRPPAARRCPRHRRAAPAAARRSPPGRRPLTHPPQARPSARRSRPSCRALNLFSAGTAPLAQADLRIGQALADVATIGLLQEHNVRRAETLAEQLQAALNSRVVIEQAKGRLAGRLGLDMDQAFALLRDHARTTNQRLTDIARHVIDNPAADFPASPRLLAGRDRM